MCCLKCTVFMCKGKHPMSILMVKFQSAMRSFLIVSSILVLFSLVFYFVDIESIQKLQIFQIQQHVEDNEPYFLKIIPDVDDQTLNSLPLTAFSFLTVIDAGSSGCRAHVYRYGRLGSRSGPLYIIPKHNSLKVKPGLSSFAEKPADAGASLLGLVNFLKAEIPEADWTSTPIWLKATAGLRMIDSDKSAAILSSVRDFLGDKKNSPFLFRPSWAKIIPGNEEGSFGWIAVNYLYKYIGPRKVSGQEPYAVVEMGGASTQVTQIAPNAKIAQSIPNTFKFSFKIGQETYVLYTQSYLGYGGEQAREAVNKAIVHMPKSSSPENVASKGGEEGALSLSDACINRGFVRPKGKERKDVYEGAAETSVNIVGDANGLTGSCRELIRHALFSYDQRECKTPAPHSFNCVHQPDFLVQSKNFLIFENFFYVASGVGVKPAGHDTEPRNAAPPSGFPLVTTPKEFMDSAAEVCTLQWAELQLKFPLDSQPKDVNTKLCFSASYTAAFLVYGLHLPLDKKVTVQKEVAGSEIEWALGAAYIEAADFVLQIKYLRRAAPPPPPPASPLSSDKAVLAATAGR